jgi:hypothetical protein
MYHITFRVYGKCGHGRVNFVIRTADIRDGSETPYVLLYINYCHEISHFRWSVSLAYIDVCVW